MYKMLAEEHIYLTRNILNSLSKNRVTTLLDFLQEDAEKLSTISKLTLPQILEIRNNILTKYSALPVDGTTLFINTLTCKQFISTGIESLDAILNNGIPVGFITEICGLAGCGKSQLCMQLAINIVKNTSNNVLYIDTKGDFSAVRIQKSLYSSGLSPKEMAIIMLKIKTVYIWCMEDLIKLFEEIKCGKFLVEDLSLIIIDSLPCLMFQHFGDDNKIGLKLLNTFVNYARHISKEKELGLVCVNIQTRWIDQDIVDFEEDDHTTSTSTTRGVHTEKWNRCLGKYWQNIPTTVLFLEKYQDPNKNCSMLKITITKKLPLINKTCMVEINSSGVK